MEIDNILQLQDQFLYDLSYLKEDEKSDLSRLNVGSLIESYYWLIVEVEQDKYGFQNMEEELDLSVLRKYILLSCQESLSISHVKPQYFFNLLSVA